MQWLRVLVGCLFVGSIVGCGADSDESNSDSTDTSSAATADDQEGGTVGAQSQGGNLITLGDDGQIEFHGESVANASELPALVTRKIANASREVELTTPLSIAAKDGATMGLLRQVVLELQAMGFPNIDLQSGDSSTPIPYPAAAQSMVAEMVVVKLALSSDSDGEMVGMVADGEGINSFIESGDMDLSVEFVENLLDRLLTPTEDDDSTAAKQVEIELTTQPELLVRDFAIVCGAISTKLEQRSGNARLRASFWPLGYPREESIDLLPGELMESEPPYSESFESNETPREIKPFDLDDSNNR